jgi:hypothetical protein
VLFAEASQEIRALDERALFLFRGLRGGSAPLDLAERYAASFGMAPAAGRRVVAGALAAWRGHGWLASPAERGVNACEARPPRPRPAVRPCRPLAPRTPQTLERHYRLLDSCFALRLEPGPLEQVVLPVLAHLEIDREETTRALLAIETSGTRYVLLEDGVPVEEPAPLHAITPLVKMHLRRLSVDQHRYFAQLHAAAVLAGDGCWLLPGETGSGKTTLAATLLAAGFSLLSDEVVLLEPETLAVRPVPLALTVKCGAVAPLSALHPALAALPVHEREDGKRVRYLPPPPASVAADHASGYPVRGVVFPRYRAGRPGELGRIGRLEALGRLLGACVSLPDWLDRRSVARMVEWMSRLDCYELRTSDPSDALARMRTILSPISSRPH